MRPAGGPGGEIALAWLCVAAWIAVIQSFASPSFSSGETSRFLDPLLRWLFPAADADWIAAARFAVRKAGHLIEYAILALFALRALYLSFERPLAQLAAASLLLVLVVAAVDEWRQALAKDRTGSLADVALDLAGAASALVIAGVARRHSGARP